MMNESFAIADLHFGHKKIITYEPSRMHFLTIEEHDAELVYRWNSVVRKLDTVWVLGDVLFGKHSFQHLSLLNGTKKLILGNHDHYQLSLYQQHFSKIYGSFKLKDCILTHIPIHPSQFHRFKLNLHGHLHSGVLDDLRYVNVSAQQQNLTPILLRTLISERLEKVYS